MIGDHSFLDKKWLVNTLYWPKIVNIKYNKRPIIIL